ncbi:hypothetical protein [Anatilimnocola floriformis]|uniref:hypothetical protein n=1 Tax=Anatilimnocola floriformis TaxID=2948575 RepID=UPI0020C2A96F|nr:hypothetical protein [Anatilimnocola floriformis]
MTDKMNPGDSPQKGPFNSRAWNRVVESADDYHDRRAQGVAQKHLPLSRPSQTVIQLRNSCGANLRRGEVLEIDDYILDPLDNASLWFNGVTPNMKRSGWAIALEPIPYAPARPRIGAAVMNGTCVGIVEITNSAHRFARRDAERRTFVSAERGAVKILHVGRSVSGGNECAVHILDDTPNWFLGIVREDYTQSTPSSGSSSSTAKIKIDVYTRDLDGRKWRKLPGVVIEAEDWFLNKGEKLEKKTKVRVDWYINCWAVTGMYCSPSDLDELKPKSPSTGYPGEQEPTTDTTQSSNTEDIGNYGETPILPGYDFNPQGSTQWLA